MHQTARPRHAIRLGSTVEGDRARSPDMPRSTSWPTAAPCAPRCVLLRRRPRSAISAASGSTRSASRPTTAGGIKVDPQTFQTSVPHIYAAGDVIGFPEPCLDLDGAGPGRRLPRLRRAAAAAAGNLSLRHLFGAGNLHRRPCPRNRCARAAFPTRSASRASARPRAATSWALNTGFLKLLFSIETRRLLGAHIVGEGATELIHIGQAVINLRARVDFFVENTFNYPTLAEAYKIAGLDAWNRMTRKSSFTSSRACGERSEFKRFAFRVRGAGLHDDLICGERPLTPTLSP